MLSCSPSSFLVNLFETQNQTIVLLLIGYFVVSSYFSVAFILLLGSLGYPLEPTL